MTFVTPQLLNSIVELINSQQFSKASPIIKKLLRNNPKSVQLWHLKSIIAQGLGNIASCEKALLKTLALDPNHLPALSNLAKLQTHKQLFDSAISTYQKILELDTNNLHALFHIGMLLNKTKQYSNAELYLRKAHTNNAQDINIKLALGQALLNQDLLEESIALFNEIILSAPHNIAALNNKGIALKKQCKWKEAIQILQKALNIAPKQNEIIKNLASCYTLIGDYNESKKLYNKVINTSPLDQDAHHWLNQMLWESKDPEFLNSYRKALLKHPKATGLMFDLAHKQKLAGQINEAKETLENIIKVDKTHVPSLVELGTVLRELEKFQLSHEYIRKADRYDNSNKLIKEELGISYLSLNDPLKAIDIFNELLKQDPFQQAWWAYKATALKLLGSSEYDYLYNYDHVLITTIDVPKGYSSLKQFNKELVTVLKEYHYAKTNPLDQSLISGSQTSEKLFDYHVPIIQELRECFRDKTIPFLQKLPKDSKHPLLSRNTGNFVETDSWSVILFNNGYHKNHHHPAGWYSGPYYAQLPDVITNSEEKQGWVKFGQPGFKMLTPLEPDLIVQPTEGMMVRFPSYFWHGTIPFHSPQERITVPGDIMPV